MKRNFALSIFLLIRIFSCFFIYDHIYEQEVKAVQENASFDFSMETSPSHLDNGKQDITVNLLSLVLFVHLVLFVYHNFHLIIQLLRRSVLLSPVFHQSNYVILPLLNKK
ncbi:MAG TPA: hypothetical protein VEY51_13575 [Chondromyces sp.]|nr:hypothetical protein [Chondromyces sp.]